MKTINVEAKTENLNEILNIVDAMLEEAECSPKITVPIDIAVEEIFVNIANYAYPDKTGDAEITTYVEDGVFHITFSDSGIPYDPLAKEDPDVTLGADERPIGGLGIYMVKKSMDKVEYKYENGHNVFSFEKKLS